MTSNDTDISALAYDIASIYSAIPNVEAVAMAGSHLSKIADEASDLDLYVYLRDDITLNVRAVIAKNRASQAEIDNQFWEPGDEWIERESGVSIDVMFRRMQWIEREIEQTINWHRAMMGYSTCLWHNVLHSETLFDRNGWYSTLKLRADVTYPAGLQKAIIAKNYPVLRDTQSSYYRQIEKAIKRKDLVSINHRIAALLASCFDVVFAINKMAHPGEKRLLDHLGRCSKLPADMPAQIEAIIAHSNRADSNILEIIAELIDGLYQLLRQEKLYPVED
jgi:hypothetical protein